MGPFEAVIPMILAIAVAITMITTPRLGLLLGSSLLLVGLIIAASALITMQDVGWETIWPGSPEVGVERAPGDRDRGERALSRLILGSATGGTGIILIAWGAVGGWRARR